MLRENSRLKILFVLSVFSILIIISSNQISAVDSCWIETNGATCTQNGGNSVMRLSAVTNAHGELASQSNYANVLCCNFGFGTNSCAGNNKNLVLRISSQTNAHAESPSLVTPNYNVDICYDSVQNARRVDSGVTCNTLSNEIPVLYISNLINAHIEGAGLSQQNYGSKICAVVNQTAPTTQCSDGIVNDGNGCSD